MSHEHIEGNYSWVPYHIVSVSSEEFGYYADQLAQQGSGVSNKGWESERLGDFPVEMIIRFHYRVELDYVVMQSKDGKVIPAVEIQIGDGLEGEYQKVEYRQSGCHNTIGPQATQLKCYGIGSYLKLIFRDKPSRSGTNPYAQISLAQFKVWGRLTGYETKLQNKQLDLKSDRVRMNKILLEMGVPISILNYYNKNGGTLKNMPIDRDTLETLEDMMALREEYMDKEDFEGLKQITIDMKKVEKIGRKIFELQQELEFVVAKQGYDRAIALKQEIKQLTARRDKYDALYETRRYVRMIELMRPTTGDFNNSIFQGDKGIDDENAKNEMDQIIQNERSKFGKTGLTDESYMQTNNSNLKTPRSILKQSILEETKIEEEIVESEMFGGKNNALKENQGDKDLENIFKPLMIDSKGEIPEGQIENLTRLQQLGLLDVFGVNVWKAIYASDWRVRRAAAQAVLNYIEMPLNAKYIGKSKNLFLACVEMARLITEDKILEIYFIGLKILTTCLAPPICGDDIPIQVIERVLTEFAPILIKKIQELKVKARKESMHTLITIFRHQVASLQVLVDACMDICVKERDIILYGKSQKIPIEKQPAMILIARLEVMLQILIEFGYDEKSYDWREPFDLLLIPSFFHPNIDVRNLAIDLCLMFFQLIGEEVRDWVFQEKGLKPQIQEELAIRMEDLEEIMLQNGGGRQIENDGLHEIQEEDEEGDQDEENNKQGKPVTKKEVDNLDDKSSKTGKSKKSKKNSQTGKADDSKKSKNNNADDGKSSRSKKSKRSEAKSKKSKRSEAKSKKSKKSKSDAKSKKSKKSKKSVVPTDSDFQDVQL